VTGCGAFALLITLPYATNALMYLVQYYRVFGRSHDREPEAWIISLVVPLLIASLTSLALAAVPARRGLIQYVLLVLVGVAIFGTALLVVLFVSRGYFRMRDRVPVGRYEFGHVTWAGLTLWVGLIVIAGCSVGNIWALVCSCS
jgi:hypothetical protein